MAPQTTIGRIFALLVPTIIVAVANSYIPHDYALIRQLLSYVQLAFMSAIAVVTVKFVLEDF